MLNLIASVLYAVDMMAAEFSLKYISLPLRAVIVLSRLLIGMPITMIVNFVKNSNKNNNKNHQGNLQTDNRNKDDINETKKNSKKRGISFGG
jgi:hypothetical protein